MPEDKYSFIPKVGNFDGARSFGEQVKHVACAQFAFFNEFEGKKPPDDCEKGGHDPAKKRARPRRGPLCRENTKLGISVIAVWHITDHYGQLVEYLRLNGIVPPWTQKYGVKVRGLVGRRRSHYRIAE